MMTRAADMPAVLEGSQSGLFQKQGMSKQTPERWRIISQMEGGGAVFLIEGTVYSRAQATRSTEASGA